MKLRHAAALVLCLVVEGCSLEKGWYRMIPPIASNKPDTAAPLTQWHVNPVSPYRSEQECQADVVRRQADTSQDQEAFILWPNAAGNAAMLAEQRKLARCVSSDDPLFSGVNPTRMDAKVIPPSDSIHQAYSPFTTQ